jgi:serine/threonine protein phosphatase 1
MLGWRNKPAAADPVARAPAGTRLYAVGDIHGRDDLLARLVDQIRHDADSAAPGTRRVVIYVGDYIDRGMESRQVIDRLMHAAPEGFESVHLLGNHEEAFLDFLDGAPIAFDWFRYGGLETLHSYNVPVPRRAARPVDMEDARRRALAAVPPSHVAFLRGCKLWHAEGDYVFVHAGVRPGVPFERQEAADLLWIRDTFLTSRADHGGKVIVHGHTICEQPEVRPNRINIDTGAYATGRLTCLVLESDTRRFLST